MRSTFVDNWHQDGQWVGYCVRDGKGSVVARVRHKRRTFEEEARAWEKAKRISDQLNTSGIARERALRKTGR